MWLVRQLGLADVVVLVVVFLAVAMPSRPMRAEIAATGEPQALIELATAEAAALAVPTSGETNERYSRALAGAGHIDWATDVALRAGEANKEAPDRWMSLRAASQAYSDRLDAPPALELARSALMACDNVDDTACPPWEHARLSLYNKHLEAGVASGIDARLDPKGFRKAGEDGLHLIQLRKHPDLAPPRAPSSAPSPAPSPAPAPTPAPASR